MNAPENKLPTQAELDQAKAALHQRIAREGCGSSIISECIKMVTIMPLRYCVICSENQDALTQLAPELPATLGKRLLKPLASARYGISLLREGYLYAFVVRRDAETQCEAVIRVDSRGHSYLEKTAGKRKIDTPYSMLVRLHNPEDMLKLHLLFTPDKLTDRMLDELCKNEKLLGKVTQTFDPQVEMRNPQGEDVLPRDQIEKYLSDFIGGDIALKTKDDKVPNPIPGVIQDQLFYAGVDRKHEDGMQVNRNHIAAELQCLKRAEDQDDYWHKKGKSFAVVLDDPIGITQQLNAWRNAGIEDTLKVWLEENNGENERELTVANALDDLKRVYQLKEAHKELQALRKSVCKSYPIYDQTYFYVDTFLPEYEKIKQLEEEMTSGTGKETTTSYLGRIQVKEDWLARRARRHGEEFEKQYARIRNHIDEVEDEFKSRLEERLAANEWTEAFKKQFGPYIDLDKIELPQGAFRMKCREAEKIAAARVNDHKLWGLSDALYTALEVYDKNDEKNNYANGWCFSAQTGKCFIGSDGNEAYATIFDHWWAGDAEDLRNLGLRSLALNQGDIAKELAALDKEAAAAVAQWKTDHESDSTEKMLKWVQDQTKNVITKYKQADKCFDGLKAAGLEHVALASFWLASNGKKLFGRKLFGSSAERALFGRLFARQAAFIGKDAIGVRIRAEQTIRETIDKRRLAGLRNTSHYRNYIPKEMGRYMEGSTAGPYGRITANSTEAYKLRSGGLFLLFEAAVLLWKWNDRPADMRAKDAVTLASTLVAFVGQGMSVWADSASLIAKGMKVANRAAPTAAKAAAKEGAEIYGQRWKFWGGGLTLVGGGLAAVTSVFSATQEARRENRGIAYAYYMHAVTTFIGVAGYSAIILTTTRDFLRYAMENAPGRWGWRILENMAARFSTPAAMRFIALGMVRVCGWWVSTAILTAIWIFSDSDLVAWAKRCCFSKTPNDPYPNGAEELMALYSATKG